MPRLISNIYHSIEELTRERLVQMVRECESGEISLGVIIANENNRVDAISRDVSYFGRDEYHWTINTVYTHATHDLQHRYICRRTDSEILICSRDYWNFNAGLRTRANQILYDNTHTLTVDEVPSYSNGIIGRWTPIDAINADIDASRYLYDAGSGYNTAAISVDEAMYGDYTYANTSYTPYLTGSWANTYSIGTGYNATDLSWSDLGYANIATSPLRFEALKTEDYNEIYEKLFGERCKKEEELNESPELDKYLEEFLVIKP